MSRPASEILCDFTVVALALWTLCCHAVVAAGGTLRLLMLLYLVVGGGIVAAILVRRRRVAEVEGPPRDPPAVPQAADPLQGAGSAAVGLALPTLSVAVVAAGVAVWLAMGSTTTPLWWWTTLVLAAAAVIVLREPVQLTAPTSHARLELGLWALAAFSVVIALASHRPDLDDSLYINMAVGAVDNPQLPLLAFDTMHGIEGLPVSLNVYRVHSYEILNAALARLTGLPAIYCFHWVSAALAALLLPLAYARLFRRLLPLWWLFATVVLVVVLLGVGDPGRWYGNFALVRIWQGKALFLTVLLPLIYSYGLDFGVRPTLRGWLYLAAAQIAAVGCTSSAFWGAPLAAAIGLATGVSINGEGIRRMAAGGLSSLYLIAIGLSLKSEAAAAVGTQTDAAGQDLLARVLKSVLGDSRLFICAIAAVILGWAVSPTGGRARRFALVSSLIAWGLLLNPFVSGLIIRHVTGPVYWRALWGLPLPILMTLVLLSPIALGVKLRRPRAGQLLTCLLVVLFVACVPSYSGLSSKNKGLSMGWPGLKVPQPAYFWAEELNLSVKPGDRVLAPSQVAAWVPTFHNHAYPVFVRKNYLKHPSQRVALEEGDARRAMNRYVNGQQQPNGAKEFEDALERFAVDAVCLRSGPTLADARGVLEASGFCLDKRQQGAYEIWVRCAADAEVRTGGPQPGP